MQAPACVLFVLNIGATVLKLTEKDIKQILKAIKPKWDAIIDVRLNEKLEWEVAINNVLNTKHWIGERSTPAMVTEILERVSRQLAEKV
jgi:hypothetical protein